MDLIVQLLPIITPLIRNQLTCSLPKNVTTFHRQQDEIIHFCPSPNKRGNLVLWIYIFRVFLISVCRAKFGESWNLEKMIGTPPLDDQMNISLQKNVLNSLQPPKTASTGPKFCCSQKVSFLKGSFRCSPNHIQHWNMECHTPLERSRIAFYGYVNFWSPNQTIWWPGAIEGFWR